MSAGLSVHRDGDVLRVTLDRPDRRNALDESLIAALTVAFTERAAAADVRFVVLSGRGKVFCAGADLGYMRRMAAADEAANLEDARRLGALFSAISDCPRPVVARVHGAAIGGGLGLVAAADLVLSTPDARFGFTEVRLGLVPGVISPFALRRLGPAVCRRLFLSGELFDGREAHRLGLVDEICAEEDLDGAEQAAVARLRMGGPQAQRAAKELLDTLTGRPWTEQLERTPAFIARQRGGEEAAEGLAAFFDKRPPRWVGGGDG